MGAVSGIMDSPNVTELMDSDFLVKDFSLKIGFQSCSQAEK